VARRKKKLAEEIAQAILAQKAVLAMRIAEGLYRQVAEDWTAAAEACFQKSAGQISQLLEQLAAALSAADMAKFTNYTAQVQTLFASQGCHPMALPQTLATMRDVLHTMLPWEHHNPLDRLFDAAMSRSVFAAETKNKHLRHEKPLSILAQDYLNSLLAGERQKASRLILTAAAEGMKVGEIYGDVFLQTQREIERLWQINKVSAVRQLYCTSVTQLIMAQLYQYIFATEKNGLRMVAASAGGVLHEIRMRMVADYFEMAGWDTCFLGAQNSTDNILQAVAVRQPHVVAILTTSMDHVAEISRLIAGIRQQSNGQSPKIILGGYPFNITANLWQEVDGDGTAGNAHEALQLAIRLVGGAAHGNN
jgi:methanogenic corrinoid protein MtbC1